MAGIVLASSLFWVEAVGMKMGVAPLPAGRPAGSWLSVFALPLQDVHIAAAVPHTWRMAYFYCHMLLFSILFVTGILYASILEWLLHRYVMHRPVGPFRYPFETHAMVHHRTFKADHTYHLIHEKDREIIPMAWWNGPVLILISSVPAVVVSLIIGSWIPWFAALASVGVYYCAYEYIHWCMHVPKTKRRVVEKSGIFYRLNGHHLLHHRYMGKNFNVVFPFADLVFGTLLLRSKIHFKQASGHSVPNVQPREVRA